MGKIAFEARLRSALFAVSRGALLIGLLLSTAAPAAGQVAEPTSTKASEQSISPHLVIENIGQFAEEARYLLRQGNHRIWLTADAVWLDVPDLAVGDEQHRLVKAGPLTPLARQRHALAGSRSGAAIRFVFEGANSTPALEPVGRLATRVSYLIGNDPSAWRTDVPVWSGVRYRDLYPGVDLVVGGNDGGTVLWRLQARPGADLSAVKLRAEGADAVVAEAGRLRLTIKGRTLDVALPSWSIEGQETAVGSVAVQQPNRSAFALAPDNGTAPMVASLAPTAPDVDLVYFTTLAGAASDVAYALASDGVGNTYITGETQSTNLPVSAGSYDFSNNGTTELTEAFVAKYGAGGSPTPLYLTYLGGSDLDIGWGIGVSGNLAFVAGETMSADFPGMTGAVSGTDAFVAVINADGSGVRYVSRLGGSGYDAAYGLAVAGLEAYVVGTTNSPTICPSSSTGDLLVAKFNSAGTLVYSSCLPSADPDAGYGIAVQNGEAYVAGDTTSSVTSSRDITTGWFTTTGAPGGGTVIETSGNDWTEGVAVAPSGSFYVVGTTATSSGFPGTAATAPWGGGGTDAIVMKLSRVGGTTALTLDFATYVGGEGNDSGYGIAVDTVEAVYVTGITTSASFPMTLGAYRTTPYGGSDAFVARMHLQSTAADKVTYATYLGAGFSDSAYGAATDTGGHAYVSGSSQSTADADSANAFVAKVKVSTPPGQATVTISVSGTGALLQWGTTTPASSKYQVFRSTEPYFKPGDWSSVLQVEQSTLSHTDPNVLSTVGGYFYLVKGVDATPAAGPNSNRTGKFTYELVKGTTP